MNKLEDVVEIVKDCINRLQSDLSGLENWDEEEALYCQEDLDSYISNLQDDFSQIIGDLKDIKLKSEDDEDE